jgi:hypothetical protein
MAASGLWNIIIKTPLGDQSLSLDLQADGSTLTGALAEPDGDRVELFDGKADGNHLSWRAKVKKPMPMTLQFTAVVDGDAISGSAKAMLGSASFTGTRA